VASKTQVVILNGVGSVGKGAVAKALQEIASKCFLHVAMDAFLDMMPASAFGDEEGIVFEPAEVGGKPVVAIRTGQIGQRVLRGMRRAIAAMAAAGNDLIVDDVMLNDEMRDYEVLLRDFEVFTVGLFAPLDVLEERERQRGDRLLGFARWQYDRVHNGMVYDLEIDTARASAIECAQMIKAQFGL
jgi:chloramphenicol 3-O phosphotransferase